MFKKILNTISTQFLGSLINLFTFIIISHTLGAHYTGEARLILSTIAIVLIAINLISGASLIYLFPRVHKGTLIYISYVWAFLLSITAYIGLHIYNVYQPLLEEYIHHIAILTFFNAIFNTNLNVLISSQKINLNNRLKLYHYLLILPGIAAAIFLLDIKDSSAYVIGLYLSYITITILSSIQIAPYLKEFNTTLIKPIVRQAIYYGAWNQSGHIIQTVNLRLSYYILHDPGNLSSIALGNFSNAASICESIWIVTRSVALVQYSKIVNTEDNEYNVKLSLDLSKWSFIICTIGLIPLLLLPTGFYQFVFGEEFYLMPEIIKYLAPSIVFYNFANILGHYYSGNGRYQINLYAALIGFVITLSSIHYMINQYQHIGAAIVSSASYFASTLFMLSYFMKDNHLKWSQLIPKWSEFKAIIRQK
jgi:O-antigen/teichoic acid export membrane protein